MTVDSKSWHARVYLWWYKQKYGHEKLSASSNLCPYMRAVLFWSWMRWLFIKGKIGRVPVPAIIWPLFPLGVPLVALYFHNPRWWIPYVVYLGTAASVGFISGCVALLGKLKNKRIIPQGAVNFGHLLRAYGESAHTRICPEIELK